MKKSTFPICPPLNVNSTPSAGEPGAAARQSGAPRVSFVECNPYDARLASGELATQLGMPVRSVLYSEIPPSGPIDARGFNIGTGKETSVNDLARTLLRVADSQLAIEYAAPRAGEQRRSVLSIDRADGHYGWRPSVTLEQGLRGVAAWASAELLGS